MSELSIDVRALPHGLQPIVRHLGLQKAIKLLTVEQGQMFYIPEKPTATHHIVEVFGMELVTEWVERYPPGAYQIPMLGKILCQLRNKDICSALDDRTSSIQQLVKRFGITRQQITNIYNDHKQSDGHTQLALL